MKIVILFSIILLKCILQNISHFVSMTMTEMLSVHQILLEELAYLSCDSYTASASIQCISEKIMA